MVVLDALGARWTLDVSGLEQPLGAELLHLWERAVVPSGTTPDAVAPDGYAGDSAEAFVVGRTAEGALTIDGRLQSSDDLELPYAVSRALTLASIRRRTGSCVMLHAAGLAGPDGATVALVAASGTGKTTAARVLGRRLGYVSDETVTVEHDLSVSPHAKPLSIVVDPDVPRVKHEQSPDDLGLLRAPASLTLVAVVVLERRADAAVPALEPIGLVEAMSAVLSQTSSLPHLDRPLDRLARVLAAGHGPWRLTYREIDDCGDLVTALARVPHGPSDDAVTWSWIPGDGDEYLDPVAPDDAPFTLHEDVDTSTMVCRTAFRDAISSDGDVLVLQGWAPVTLPGLAATVWLAAASPVSVADLLTVATDQLGPHPDGEQIVVQTVRALLNDELLRLA